MRRLKILAVQVCLAAILLEAGLRLYQPIPFRVRGDRIVLPVHQVYTFDNHGASKLDPVTHHTKNALGIQRSGSTSRFRLAPHASDDRREHHRVPVPL